MTLRPPSSLKLRIASALAAIALTGIAGCDLNDRVTGGSSEVDNPIVVAFTNASGRPLDVTGSLSIYLADQNPSVDPEPLLRKQLAGASSVKLTGADFTQGVHFDSARAYNLLLLSDDSSGTLLRDVRFDPRSGRYTTNGSASLTSVKLAPARLVRYASALTGIDTGLVRVFVPGSPFQTVLVDSEFVFEAVPAGELPFHAVVGSSEFTLARDSGNGGPRHRIDTTRPPRPAPGPPRPDSLKAFAGPDVVIYLPPSGGGALPFNLNGNVVGVDPSDPRLAVLWKQVADSGLRVQLRQQASRQARTEFTEAGMYLFAFTASFGSAKSEDTVRVSVQPTPGTPRFTSPGQGFVVYLNEPFEVSWYSTEADTLELQYRPDSSGQNWLSQSGGTFPARIGMNQQSWTPSGDPANPVNLRLVNRQGVVITSSEGFAVLRRTPPPDTGAAPPRP